MLLGHRATQDQVPHRIPEEGQEAWARGPTRLPLWVTLPQTLLWFHLSCHTAACGLRCVECLTCRTGLVCVLGKDVGLSSHRIRSRRDRHLVPGSVLPPPASCWSPSRPNRRWWWSRYADFRDRKRANHL